MQKGGIFIGNGMDFNYMTANAHAVSEQNQTKKPQNQAIKPNASADGADGGTAGFLEKFREKSGGTDNAPEARKAAGRVMIPEAGRPTGRVMIPEAGRPTGTGEITEADREAMSMTEYKLYLYGKISALPVHPWNLQDYVAVFISDDGLEAMKNDPEYEAWVLDCLRKNFQACDPWGARCGGKFVIFHFGATKEECRVESWRPPCRCEEERERLFRKKARDALWERRRKKRKALLALWNELAEKKALSRRMAVSDYYADLAALPPEAEEIPPADCDARAMQIYSSFKANILLRMFSIKNQ